MKAALLMIVLPIGTLYLLYFLCKFFSGWSSVKKGRKPAGWWANKILCEVGWALRYLTNNGWPMYHYHLNRMCVKYKINLYGEKI